MLARCAVQPIRRVLLWNKVPAIYPQCSTTTAIQNFDEEKTRLLAELNKDFPKPYDGPERDLVNFPRKPRAIYPGKVRMGFIPEEWFQFFYRKTGVTGPYVFGTGLLTFLLSKEWYVIEEELSTGVALFIIAFTAIKKFGPQVKAYGDKLVDDQIAEHESKKSGFMKGLEDAIALEKKKQWQQGGREILIEAKRENVQIQLEAEYRSRLMTAYQQVKKRLDYFLEIDNTRKKMEQKHMVEWIINNVMKSITPQQEKEALQKCIDDLKVLSARTA